MREICQGIHDVFIISCGVEFFSYVLFTHLHHNIIIDLHKYVITAVQKKIQKIICARESTLHNIKH